MNRRPSQGIQGSTPPAPVVPTVGAVIAGLIARVDATVEDRAKARLVIRYLRLAGESL